MLYKRKYNFLNFVIILWHTFCCAEFKNFSKVVGYDFEKEFNLCLTNNVGDRRIANAWMRLQYKMDIKRKNSNSYGKRVFVF